MEAAKRDFDDSTRFATIGWSSITIWSETLVCRHLRLIRREMAAAARSSIPPRISTQPPDRISRRNPWLGRACVATAYGGRAITLLFRGISAYAARSNRGDFRLSSLPPVRPRRLWPCRCPICTHLLLAAACAPARPRCLSVISNMTGCRAALDPTTACSTVPPLAKAYLALAVSREGA